ncbi:MAG: hypothetical protein KDG51_22660, partial [Calditrichaeota bacterium]|nr:hypothetical protein [Calditrichota bacterium]
AVAVNFLPLLLPLPLINYQRSGDKIGFMDRQLWAYSLFDRSDYPIYQEKICFRRFLRMVGTDLMSTPPSFR